MKTQTHRKASTRGSALIITLVLGVIMLVIAVSYLQMIGTQQKLVVRSESWNTSLTLAEAGVEEALAQMNASQANFSSNGWTASGSLYGPTSRTLAGGSYSVIISNATLPVIYSTGYVAVAVSGDKLFRAVRVVTKFQAVANVGIGAKNGISFNGNGTLVDSYNSHMTNLSNNGIYDSKKTSTNGNVAGVTGAVDPGNHTIAGNLYLGSTANYGGGAGNVTGTIYHNFNIDYKDVVLPSGPWQAAPLSGGVHSITTSGYYTISDASPIDIKAGVTASFDVTTLNYNLTGLQIHGGTTNSGTAKIYLNGPSSVGLAGNSAVDASNRPENLLLYGMPSLTGITFSGNAGFTGVIYAPEASLTLNGGGNNSQDVSGSVIVSTITSNGHFMVHYDEALIDNTPSLYVATSWQEL